MTFYDMNEWAKSVAAADYEAADMVHRNRLGLAREAAAASTVDVLAAEVRELHQKLIVATRAAEAANAYYWAEFAGAKTYLTPTETRERFGSAMVAYREATGVDTCCAGCPDCKSVIDPFGTDNA